MKHWNGPWTFVRTEIPTDRFDDKGERICVKTNVICGQEDWIISTTDPLKKEDAHLIAAAPEIFDALVDVRHWLLSLQCGSGSTARSATFYLDEIERVLKKVRDGK
jgi:hypothetical protein